MPNEHESFLQRLAIPKNWQHFFLSVFLHLLLPLLPLFIEFWLTDGTKRDTVLITAVMYAITIAISSKNLLLLFLTLCSSIFFALAFAMSTSPDVVSTSSDVPRVALFGIVIILLSHGIERFYRHVIGYEPFLAFLER